MFDPSKLSPSLNKLLSPLKPVYRRYRRYTDKPVVLPEIGTSFRAGIFARHDVASLDDVDHPTMRMWIEYALDAPGRGAMAVASMGGSDTFAGKRVLDVGCAYGGFLVAANAAGAKSVTGVDIDESLIELARKQLTDHHVEAVLAVEDVTQPGFPERYGTFDIVLCNSVIEHVVDPEILVRHLAEVMAPGASVYLAIPNYLSIDMMIADGHYELFGITILDRVRAEQWWEASDSPARTYGMEHYAPIDHYLDMFSRNGISLRLLNQPPDDLDTLAEEVAGKFQQFEQRLSELDSNAEGVAELQRRGAAEIATFNDLLVRYRGSENPVERSIHARTMWLRYSIDDWEVAGSAPR